MAWMASIALILLLLSLLDSNSLLRAWLWCRRNGFVLETVEIGEKVYWWGADDAGNAWIPAKNGCPTLRLCERRELHLI